MAPYCWPPNGSRICVPENKVEFYWPPRYYNDSETSRLFIEVNGLTINEADHAGSGTLSTYLNLNFENTEVAGRPNDFTANITITERRMTNDSGFESSDYTWHHQGPIVTLVSTPTASSTSRTRLFGTPTSTQTPTATSSPSANGPKVFTPGEIAGLCFGCLLALALLVTLAYSCCEQCCLPCCHPGEAERRRVKAAERRRVQQEREYAQPHVDAIKAAVARGEVWNGPVRPGGMWVSRSSWPAAPARAARPESRAQRDDEITAVDANVGDGDGRRWMQEQRTELQRIEARRREEQRVAARREEIVRTEEGQPPAYEAPPPKYTP